MIKKKLRTLLAEGDPTETTAGLRELYPESQDGLELTIVSTIPTLIATLEIVNPEVIFVDLSLAHPDPSGAVRRVHCSAPEVPLIVLADSGAAHSLYQQLFAGFGKRFVRDARRPPPAKTIQPRDTRPRGARNS